MIPNPPMLAKPVKTFNDCKLDFNNAIYEEKYDGSRLLAFISKLGTTIFYSRTLKQEMHDFTIILKDDVTSCILDGECVYVNENNEIVPICNTGVRNKLRKVYKIFDIQYKNDISVMNLSTIERKRLLIETIVPNVNVELSQFYECKSLQHMQYKFNEFIKNPNNEGFMIKMKTDLYISNSRIWLKLKKLHMIQYKNEYDLHAYKAFKDRNGTYSIIECGNIDENGSFKTVCKVSSGLTHAHKKRIQHSVDNRGLFLSKTIITIIADMKTRNKSLRHPIFKQFRDDLL